MNKRLTLTTKNNEKDPLVEETGIDLATVKYDSFTASWLLDQAFSNKRLESEERAENAQRTNESIQAD